MQIIIAVIILLINYTNVIISININNKNIYLNNHTPKKNLSIYQWRTIKSLIQNPGLTSVMKKKINNIIYSYYEDWATHKAFQFKKCHKYKLKHISGNELSIYSKKGLYEAIKNYNGKFSFTNYASIYVNGELYKGLTELFPISSIPKSERIVKKIYQKKEWFNYKRKLSTKFIGKDEWLLDKAIDNKIENQLSIEEMEKYIDFWKKINNMDAFSKRVFEYKYDFLLKKQRSNKHISELMVCSEEHVRKTLQNTIEQFIEQDKNKDKYNILYTYE